MAHERHQEEEELGVARSIDLTGEVCPMTFFKAKLHLERLRIGEVLEVLLKDGEQMRNVPRGIKEEGHQIVHVRREDDRYRVFIRRQA